MVPTIALFGGWRLCALTVRIENALNVICGFMAGVEDPLSWTQKISLVLSFFFSAILSPRLSFHVHRTARTPVLFFAWLLPLISKKKKDRKSVEQGKMVELGG
eukprot:RCo010275